MAQAAASNRARGEVIIVDVICCPRIARLATSGGICSSLGNIRGRSRSGVGWESGRRKTNHLEGLCFLDSAFLSYENDGHDSAVRVRMVSAPPSPPTAVQDAFEERATWHWAGEQSQDRSRWRPTIL
eukprot:107800-Rhodomonas_salina.2